MDLLVKKLEVAELHYMLSASVCVCVSVCRASMSPDLFRSSSYIYMNSFILAFGVWAIIAADSVDAILMVSNELTHLVTQLHL